MYAAQITFHKPEGMEIEDAANVIFSLLGAWLQSGQLYENKAPLTIACQRLIAQVTLPAWDALDASHANKYVREDMEKLLSAGFSQPEVVIIGEDVEDTGPCACATRQAFILFTTFLHIQSPLRCGSCFHPVPLYRIPPTDNSGYYNVLGWKASYQACDTLQMGCDTLERAALREMFQVDSSLSKRGRAICDTVTDSTGVPTYYYLHRWTARSRKQELARKCPSCNGEWLLDEPWHTIFDFRCDRCRLVSNIAFDVR